MAFLRKHKKSSGTYLSIAESRRGSDGKVRQKILYNLGNSAHYTAENLKSIGLALFELGGGALHKLLKDQSSLRELGRYNYGFYLVYKKLFSDYGLSRLGKNIVRKFDLSYSIENVLMLMLMERLNEPGSKRCNYLNREEYLGLAPVQLHHLYRCLDKLDEYSERVQQLIYQKGRTLFNTRLDVVFYDVTTFYFDSEKEQGGALRQKGFSKDGKIGNTQIVYGMLIDKHQQPIGYEIYSGDQYEGHTMKDALKRLKKKFHIGRVYVVADRGMLNKDNIGIIEGTQDVDYIMGDRLRVLPKKVQEYFLNQKNYQQSWTVDESDKKAYKVRYCNMNYKGRILIGTYSNKRAEKDKTEREKRLAKAERLLQKPAELQKKAKRYYLKNDELGRFYLDEEKIKHDSRFDGYLLIATSDDQLPTATALEQYHQLYKIEQSFRTFKHYLETRPMFHWTDKRIRGHLCLCYIAYTLLTNLKLRLKKLQTPQSENALRKQIGKMQLSLIEQNQSKFYIRSKLTEEQLAILKAVKVKPLPDIFPLNSLSNYI